MTPKKVIHLDPIIANMLRPHCDQQRLTVDAALGNSYDLVLKAVLHDPMCAWIEDEDKIEALTKLMLYYQQEWLPVAWKEWIPRKEDLESSRYWVTPNEILKEDKSYLQVKYPIKPELRQKAFFWQ
jgi:hypothetical protein